ncbi:MAG: preprotein translocase subunit SecE [Chlamydiia bacterium]|nr:preprotein translocase subunit SecE [Chlamydiia bacterium]
MFKKFCRKTRSAIVNVSWPSAKEVCYVSSLVVATILGLAIPLYCIDVVSVFLFDAIKRVVWFVLDSIN